MSDDRIARLEQQIALRDELIRALERHATLEAQIIETLRLQLARFQPAAPESESP